MDPLAVAAVAVLVASLAALRRARRARPSPRQNGAWSLPASPASSPRTTASPVFSTPQTSAHPGATPTPWTSVTQLLILSPDGELLLVDAEGTRAALDPWDAPSVNDTLGRDGLAGVGPEHEELATSGTSVTLVLDASGSRLSLVQSRDSRADDEGWS